MSEKQQKFEDSLKKLEQIVSDLESGDLPLDDSLKLFEQGIKLVKVCQKKLEEAEQKVEILLKDEEGNIEIGEFEE
jgi:exodeoxyribonuclease VII small subunit